MGRGILTASTYRDNPYTVKMRRKPRPPYHHGDLRAALLASGLEILRRDGAAALSLREVARHAGVSHQAPYHHFPSKSHLLAALACEGFALLGDELEQVQGRAADMVSKAQRTGVHYVTFAARNPERFRLMFGAEIGSRAPYPELQAAAGRVFSLLVRPFGIVPAPEPRGAPDDIVLTLWSLVHGLAALVVDGQVQLHGAALEAAALATTERLWFGLAAAFATDKAQRP